VESFYRSVKHGRFQARANVRRNRVSGNVIISTAAEYHAALFESFYRGAKHGRFTGKRELAKKLSREEDARRQYQQDIYALRSENEQLKHRLRMAGVTLTLREAAKADSHPAPLPLAGLPCCLGYARP
jgi:hypothetical protein